jgi:hypothetical protein
MRCRGTEVDGRADGWEPEGGLNENATGPACTAILKWE